MALCLLRILARPELLDLGGFGFLAALILTTSLLPARENMLPGIMGFTTVISCLLRRSRLIRIIRAIVFLRMLLGTAPAGNPLSLQLRFPIPQNLAFSALS